MSEAEFRAVGETSMVLVPVAAGDIDADLERRELEEG